MSPELPSRRRMNRLQEDNPDKGEFAEALCIETFDLVDPSDRDAGEDTNWYDAIDPDTGTKYEVKSTDKENRYRSGRFRVWEGQHRSLVASDRRGTAWYWFVLFDPAGRIQTRRVKPSTVTEIVKESGGWSESDHASTEWDYEHRLEWDEVFTDE